ncbi:MAG: cation diffusion facilitator family transporter [Deltaproteobacteria bacterium]|nr:cation diffusion facilitator family transporter [Deltaproteobacteria bacterium]
MKQKINDPAQNAAREKRFVALTSVIAAVVLTAVKIIVGINTGSLGILSEAAHSAIDLVAALVTFWAVHAACKPADREHTYGHGKIENISALFETLLLIATCVWICIEAIERLAYNPVHVDPSIWAFAIMVGSIIIDFSRSRALARVAKKYQSQALEADALHFSTDIWSSAVVIIGLVFVRLGDALGIPWLGQADAVAALVVAGIVVWVSLRLGKRSLDDLLDAVPSHMQELAMQAAALVEGVRSVTQARLRRSGPQVFVDLTLAVKRDFAFERAHEIGDAAAIAVSKAIPGADVVVHVEPIQSVDENLTTITRLIAARYGLGAHAISIETHQNGESIEVHLEVDENLTLLQAHCRASDFEHALKSAAPKLIEITTHIEPTGVHSAVRNGEPIENQEVLVLIEKLKSSVALPFSVHHLRIRSVQNEIDISFHCTIDGQTPITEAHSLTEQIENSLREQLPNVGHVLIHVEPPGRCG